MEYRPAQPSLPPIQARPVARGSRTGRDPTAGSVAGPGVSAAANRCQDLTGLAQQMCYAALYGI
jgi:hypothetical protein